MSETKKVATTVGGTLGVIAAVIGGRLIGWLFGLRVVLPLIAGLLTMGLIQRRLPRAQLFAGALGLQAADTTFWLISMLMSWNHITAFSLLLFLIFVGAAVWLAIQPGLPSGIVLLALHAYGLKNVVSSLYFMLTTSYMPLEPIITEIIELGIGIGMIVLLGLALKNFKPDSTPA